MKRSNWRQSVLLASCVFFAVASRPAIAAESNESLPAGLKVVGIEASPSSIELANRFDYRQVVLTGKLESGEQIDLTRMAKLAQSSEAVSVSPLGVVRPVSAGAGELVYQYEDQSVHVPIKVAEFGEPKTISFVRDVQPALSKMGCNAGTCHGSKDGKAGFKLSLRGYDPLYDHRALTDDHGARRFNSAAPDQSLMLLKATGSIPHVGGVRTSVGERYYEMVRSWIASGASLDLAAPRVVSIEVFPKDPILPRAGVKQQMRVLATYSNGDVRDVTREAFIESGNIEVIEADAEGVLKMLRRGEAPVLVRYEGAYAATTITVMGDRSGFVWEQPASFNYIDDLVYSKLQRVKISPSELCSDEEFVRRVYLDLTGLPPSAAVVRAFLADARPNREKRDALVDQLVGSHEYVEFWTNKWADMLQVNRKFLGEEGSVALRNWIKQQVATNRPYDEFARDVLTASGSTFENPPAAYYKVLREPAEAMENTTHLFLAVRFNCNKCHDHPFERWTQDQYYRLAAYFAQVGRKADPAFADQRIGGSAVEGAKPLVEVIYDTGSGEVTHERTGQTAAPSFPYEHGDHAGDSASRREQLARWITSPQNQYFAKSYVNRLWGYMFGAGIIEPIDDIRAGNPPTNPKLLDALTEDFVNSGFDMQHMVRTICKSRAYQHSVSTNKWNEDDQINYSHALPRRLPAEVLYDAIHAATGAVPKIPGVPAGFRAAELPDAGIEVPFLDDFGRPVRESSCECERSSGMVLGPVMKLINGPTVADALADPKNALAKLVAEEKDDAKLIEEVFLRFFARFPTEEERRLGFEALQTAGQEHDEFVAKLAEYEQTIPAKQAAWEQSLGRVPQWTPLAPLEMKSQAGAAFAKQDDNSIVVTGNLAKDVYTITAETDVRPITAVRLEALADPSLPAGGPGRAKNGNFVVSEFTLSAAPKSDPAQSAPVGLQNASADFSQESWSVIGAIDGNEGSGWAVAPEFNKNHEAVFETKEDLAKEGGALLTFTLSQQFADSTHLLGKFRISVTNSPRPVGISRLAPDLAALLAVPAEQRSDEQKAALAKHYRQTDEELKRLEAVVARSDEQFKNRRLVGVQDLAWALINNPSFLFNR